MQRKPLFAISAVALFIAVSAPVIYAKKKTPAKTPAVPQLSADEQILHVLNRLTFGGRPGDVELVRQIGIEKFIRSTASSRSRLPRIRCSKPRLLLSIPFASPPANSARSTLPTRR